MTTNKTFTFIVLANGRSIAVPLPAEPSTPILALVPSPSMGRNDAIKAIRSPSMGRNDAIKAIRKALRTRSGKAWSVTGGRGTAWGWINIDAPPARRTFGSDGTGEGSYSSASDRAELTKLLDLPRPIHHQGHSIAASSGHYDEYVARAEGRTPERYGKVYWD